MDYEEWKKYHQTSKKAGKKTLANLIRKLLENYIRNPNILNPISNKVQKFGSKELTEELDEVIKLLIRREQRDIQADEDRRILQKLSVVDLKQQGMSFKDINAILEGGCSWLPRGTVTPSRTEYGSYKCNNGEEEV